MNLKPTLWAAKTILSMTLFAGIAGFAMYSIFAQESPFAPARQPAQLEAADDVLTNGLNLINKRRSNSSPTLRASDEPVIMLLDDWIYTGKPGTSGFH